MTYYPDIIPITPRGNISNPPYTYDEEEFKNFLDGTLLEADDLGILNEEFKYPHFEELRSEQEEYQELLELICALLE